MSGTSIILPRIWYPSQDTSPYWAMSCHGTCGSEVGYVCICRRVVCDFRRFGWCVFRRLLLAVPFWCSTGHQPLFPCLMCRRESARWACSSSSIGPEIIAVYLAWKTWPLFPVKWGVLCFAAFLCPPTYTFSLFLVNRPCRCRYEDCKKRVRDHQKTISGLILMKMAA